jgi:hypothetical protein
LLEKMKIHMVARLSIFALIPAAISVLFASCAPYTRASSPGISLIEGRKAGRVLYIVEQDSLLGTVRKITYDGRNQGAYTLLVIYGGRLVKKCEETEWGEGWAMSPGAPIPASPGSPGFGASSISIEKTISEKHSVTCALGQAYDTLDIEVFELEQRISKYKLVNSGKK